jgi:predicted HTH transcriptional regulator
LAGEVGDLVWHTRAVNDGELELALAAESPRVEWKASDRTTDVLDAVCALANDLEGSGAPGFVVLGMNPKGVLTGLGYADAASRDRAQQALARSGAFVEIVQYRGDDFDSDVVGRKTVTGTVPHQLESIWQDITGRIVETPIADEGMKTLYGPQYPLNALRELARNMLQHRLYEGTRAPARITWFANRVMFNNPGGPYGQAARGELGEHSDYRNPMLTRELAALGYVERLGRGIKLARQALENNGNPPMKIETDGFTTITVWARK